MSPRNFQYACAFCGILTLVFVFLALASSGFLPPLPPSWDAEQTVGHYRSHEKGIQAGAVLLLISSTLYLALTAALSAQMQRIPGLPYAVAALQLSSGAIVAFAMMMSGMVLAAAAFRLDRPVEITQALNELFWLTLLMPWPPVMAQSFALAYAILVDFGPQPLFPKSLALLNIVAPILYIPGSALHSFKTGPLAWNGAFGLWVPTAGLGCQIVIDSVCLVLAVSAQAGGLEDSNGGDSERNKVHAWEQNSSQQQMT